MTASSEYLSPTILDSRRLFGPNLFSTHPGAVLDVECRDANARRAIDLWADEARRLSNALGWTDQSISIRGARESASLFVSAPIDGLLTATDLTEHAWVAAEARAAELPTPDATSVLRESYTRERQAMPHLVAIAEYAHTRGLTFSLDDAGCSVGSGVGVRVVPHADAALEESAEFDESFDAARDVPIALVTGSNGKTTTTRLVAAMWREAGFATGFCCSDGVWVDHQQLESGDYTGPAAARRVICDARVEAAVLETARGGMLRRGLALNHAHGAVITNISADHFGEYGVESLADLATVKRIVVRALRPDAQLVLNADDPTLRALADTVDVPVAWFSLEDHELVRAHALRHGDAATVREGRVMLCQHGTWHALGDVIELPLTVRGTAQHNIANALAATLLASVVGVPLSAIRSGLASFGAQPTDNAGRLMIRDVGGMTVVVDYAHNPAGMASLCRTAAAMTARRRLLLFGQAGNRDDAQLRALAAAAWRTQSFDRVIVKEMVPMLRGRAVGEIPRILQEGLREAGAPEASIALAASELQGVRDALAWGRAGDLLVLGVHIDRGHVMQLIDELAASDWRAGDPLP